MANKKNMKDYEVDKKEMKQVAGGVGCTKCGGIGVGATSTDKENAEKGNEGWAPYYPRKCNSIEGAGLV